MKRMLAVTSTGLVAVLAALSLPGPPSRAGSASEEPKAGNSGKGDADASGTATTEAEGGEAGSEVGNGVGGAVGGGGGAP